MIDYIPYNEMVKYYFEIYPDQDKDDLPSRFDLFARIMCKLDYPNIYDGNLRSTLVTKNGIVLDYKDFSNETLFDVIKSTMRRNKINQLLKGL